MTTGLTYLDMNGNRVTKGIQQAYWEIVDNAILNVNTGKESFWQTMKKQLSTIGNTGVQSIEYESGYHRRIDSALRMNLNEGLNQLSQKQQELIGEQFGYNGVEISVHENPAEDHQDMQGHIFTLEEYANLNNFGMAKDVNGRQISILNKYGDFRQVGTLNCYHEIFSIVIGVSKPRYTQKELDKIIASNNKGFEFEGKHFSMYDGEQLLRKIELEIRKTRETEILARSSGQNELLEKMQSRSNKLVHKYYELSRTSGLRTKLQRIRLLTKR